MSNQVHVTLSDDEIRLRSYLIWESEGRQEGLDEEYWSRARAELEAELRARCHRESLEGDSARFVLPLPPVSTPPIRSTAERLGNSDGPLGKARELNAETPSQPCANPDSQA